MTEASALARLIDGPPHLGQDEQAFPFVTVDDAGFPHAALLSRAELRVSLDGSTLFAVVAGARTTANLRRTGRALLIAVEGTTAHYAKLLATEGHEALDVWAGSLEIVEHRPDSLGIPLCPITFRPTEQLARDERWARNTELLARLADAQ